MMQLLRWRAAAVLLFSAAAAVAVEAAKVVPALARVAAVAPTRFTEPAKSAIVGIGSPDAVAALIARLGSEPNEALLRDLAEMGGNGRAAGPAVLDLLQHDHWEVRVAAARTLGYIGYPGAIHELRRMLSDENDWRMVYVAAESLGRLNARSAISDLDGVAQQHWFPPVRNTAQKAIRIIESSASYPSRWHPSNFPFEYFDYLHAGLNAESADTAQQTAAQIPTFVREPDVLTDSELKEIEYMIEFDGFDENGRHVESQTVHPQCGLRCGKTYLLGGHRGEWGGELVFRDETGGTETLLAENIEGIHRMPFGVLATAGLAHLMSNSGSLYLIEFANEGRPVARRWKVLPGAPEISGMVGGGNLFVACSGGSIVITPAGEIRMAGEASLAPNE